MTIVEIVGCIWLVLAALGFVAAIVSSFFVKKGKSDISKIIPHNKNRKNKINDDECESNCTFDETLRHTNPSGEYARKKRHSGKCDGDCANCPPHYGYRHGRWYYGHNHSEGCVFGGNSCSGGRD